MRASLQCLRASIRLSVLFAVGCSLICVETSGQIPCDVRHPRAHDYLDVNGVKARINASEVLFFGGESRFEVPAGSGIQSIWDTNIMIGGMLDGRSRTVEARRGGQTNPGPLDEQGNPPTDCQPYNRVFKVSMQDITDYERTGQVTADLLDWPWHVGAPIVDGDGIKDNYNLEGGDRPAIEGHEMLWWIFHDITERRQIDGDVIGLEFQASAFAVTSDEPGLEFTTFHRYRITHRGKAALTDAYFGMLVDADIGNYDDDLVGSDTALGLAFAYNGDEIDESTSHTLGYGNTPPAIGVIVLEGVMADQDQIDNNGDGLVDEAGEQLGMSKFMLWSERPITNERYYQYLSGHWPNGQPVTYGGSGRGFSEIPVDYMFPGNPPAFWSMENIDGEGTPDRPADWNFMWSTGPFDMEVGESKEIVVAFLWARGEDRYDSIRKLKESVPKTRLFWQDGLHIPTPPLPSTTPELYSPANESRGQPTNLTLSWKKQPSHQRHEVQISRHSSFETVVGNEITPAPSFDIALADSAKYYWRVRGINVTGPGPWSEISKFSTGKIAPSAPGALGLLDNRGYQAWAFMQVQGIGQGDACDLSAESRFGCDELGGNVVYVSFNGLNDWLMYSQGTGTEYGIGPFAPRDFELRFTETGSYGIHAQTTGRVIHVPFEAWDIGPTGPFGVNNPNDDIQLIPGLFSPNDGECVFGFGETQNDPFGQNWEVTDRIHAYYPVTGSAYDDWKSMVEPLVANDPNGCPEPPTTDLAAQLVDTDRRPLQNLILIMDPASQYYRPQGIPEGNIIRFLTTKPTPPILSAPLDGEAFAVDIDPLSLWWQLPVGIDSSRVRITWLNEPSRVVLDTTVAGSNLILDWRQSPRFGEYEWRVSYHNETEFWSEPSTFYTVVSTATEDETTVIPSVLTIKQPYPNPTNGLAYFDMGIPASGRTTLKAYDLLGRQVATISDRTVSSGWITTRWDTNDLSNGVYMIRLTSGSAVAETRVVVVR